MPELIPSSESRRPDASPEAGAPAVEGTPNRGEANAVERANAVDTYVRRKILGAVLSVVTLIGAVAVASIYFREELRLFTQWTFAEVGLGALVALLFVSDAALSPVPPDAVLLLISQSSYHQDWAILVPALGALSSVAGWIGYFGGRKIAHTRFSALLFSRFKRTGAAVIHRYGPWGIVLGALTPMPFSLTCWTAGMLEIPFRRVVGPCLLRIPRYVGYYLVMAYAETIVRMVF